MILGRKVDDKDNYLSELKSDNISVFVGTSLNDVERVFSDHSIDAVFMGAGLQVDDRLSILKYVMENGLSTSIHMKDRNSGREGMIPFVKSIVQSIYE